MKSPTDTRTREELIDAMREANEVKFVLFWGHTPKIPGQVDQSCLSNWFPAAFEIDGVKYATTEHYMMAKKAELFGDEEMLQQILVAKTPGEAKKLGRKVANFDDETWKQHRFQIVVDGNFAKFSQNKELSELLKRTGTKVLVEAAPRDRIWGIGMGRNNENAENPENWRGHNLLGFALMEVRARLNA